MNRLEQLESLAAGYAERRDAPSEQMDVVLYKAERKREEHFTNGQHRRALLREEKLKAKADLKQAVAQAKEDSKLVKRVNQKPLLARPRVMHQCEATTLVGHRCILEAGHSEGHMGKLPEGVPLDPASGRTAWCRWEQRKPSSAQ